MRLIAAIVNLAASNVVSKTEGLVRMVRMSTSTMPANNLRRQWVHDFRAFSLPSWDLKYLTSSGKYLAASVASYTEQSNTTRATCAAT